MIRRPIWVLFSTLASCSLVNSVERDRIAHEICTDGTDNDLDGLTDCWDVACWSDPSCIVEANVSACTDTRDNDGNRLVDCEDPSCSALAICQEGSIESCGDRVDNDRDGHTDCEDLKCALHYDCFRTAKLERAPFCEALHEAEELRDEFVVYDPDRWDPYTSSADKSPYMTRGMFFPNPGLNGSSGISSAAWFETGARRTFHLSAEVVSDINCRPFNGACDIRVGLDARVSELALTTPRQLFGVWIRNATTLDSSRMRHEVHRVECLMRGERVGGFDLPFVVDRGIVIEIEHPGDGEVYFSVAGQACGHASILDRESKSRLVIEGRFHDPPELAFGQIAATRVALELGAETATPECEGRTLGRSLRPYDVCTDPNELLAEFAPYVVRGPDGVYRMLSRDYLSRLRHAVRYGESIDGRKWTFDTPIANDPDQLFVTPEVDGTASVVGGYLFNEDANRFEAWVNRVLTDFERRGIFKYEADAATPTEWRRAGSLEFHAQLFPNGDDGTDWRVHVFHDGSSILRKDGRYLMWFGAPVDGQPNKFAIRFATSEDGLDWRYEPRDPPVLIADQPWEGLSVTNPSVVWTGEYFLMMYLGEPFVNGLAFGLAASTDGIHWVKHASNPQIESTPEHLDRESVEEPAILFDERRIQVWYTGFDGVSVECPAIGGGIVPTYPGLQQLTYTFLDFAAR